MVSQFPSALLDFAVRSGLPRDDRPILRELQDLLREEWTRGLQILRRHEAHGVENGVLVPGARGLLRRLKGAGGAGIKCALVSNNSHETDRVL